MNEPSASSKVGWRMDPWNLWDSLIVKPRLWYDPRRAS